MFEFTLNSRPHLGQGQRNAETWINLGVIAIVSERTSCAGMGIIMNFE
jgi:hypothetical protein